jgi:hypothetical protein
MCALGIVLTERLRRVEMRSKLLAILACAAILVAAALVLRNVTATSAAKPQTPPGFIIAIQHGLGAGCPFGGNSDQSNTINNLADFLNSRSGMVLSQGVKHRLIALETQTLHGDRPRKTILDISTAMSDTWLECVGKLTDQQISEIGYCTRTAVDVPFSKGAGVMARASGQLTISDMTTWMSKACAYRDANTPEAVSARSATPSGIYGALDQRLQAYSDAIPDQWNRSVGYTPAQAFLLAYSMISDDWLHQSPNALAHSMEAVEASIHQTFPSCQTSCLNRKPYGYMGYLYSTHTPYLFSEAVQNRLIDRLEGAPGLRRP